MERYLHAGDTLSLQGIDGQYTIRDIVGRGSSCVVYRTHFCNKDGQVTEHLLKEFNPRCLELTRQGTALQHSAADAASFAMLRQRFEDGFARQATLRTLDEIKNYTANIQNIYRDHGTVYVDMTETAGVSYADVTETSVYDLVRRVRVLTQVIGAYHANGYLHLDIKPSNVFVRPAGETAEDVLLFDFDSLVPFTEQNGKYVLDGTASLSYTTEYAPVELLSSSRRGQIGPATDLYEIGEILFEKVMGRHSTAMEHHAFATFALDVPLLETVAPQVKHLLTEIFHRTLCRAPERYQTAAELLEKLDELVELTQPKRPFLQSSLPTVSGFFTGRDEEIAVMHEVLCEDDTLILSGVGGIGKSELAKHYARRYKDEYDAVLFAPYLHDWSLLVTNDTYVPIAHIHRFEEESVASYYHRKLSAFTALCNERVLLIVDNLDALDDACLPVLWTLNCKKIITSRLNLSSVYAEVPQLTVSPLADPMALFTAHYGRPLSEEDAAVMARIFEITQGLTIEIELLAKQMVTGHFTPSDMLDRLLCGGIGASGAEQVLHTDADGTVYRGNAAGHMHALFDLSSMNEEEKGILANLALLPYTGVPVRDFRAWCEIDNLDAVNDLILRGLVQWDDTADTLALHSAIADVCILGGIRIEDVDTMLQHISDRLMAEDPTVEEIAPLANLCWHTTLMLSRIGAENTTVMTFLFYAAQFLAVNTAPSAEGVLFMMECPLTWLYENKPPNDAEVFFSIGMFLRVLEMLEPYLPARTVASKKATWQPRCREMMDNAEEAPEEDYPDDAEGIITLLHGQIVAYKITENTAETKRLHRLMLAAFDHWLMGADPAHVANTSDGRFLIYAADAYRALHKNAKAKTLYRLVLDSPTAAKDAKTDAYLSMLSMLHDVQDYNNGLALCMDFQEWLEERYPPNHKLFLQCYRNKIAFQAALVRTSKKLWKVPLFELLSAFETAEAYYNAWLSGTTDPALFAYDQAGDLIYRLAGTAHAVCHHHVFTHPPQKHHPAFYGDMALRLMDAATWGYLVTGHKEEAGDVEIIYHFLYGYTEE